MEPLAARSSAVRPRPRAQCSRKIVSDKGRKCRHTSCQSVASVDPLPKLDQKELPKEVNVIDVLHRDQRTVCVSSECGDFVRSASAKDFECHAFRTRRSGKYVFDSLRIRFSVQSKCYYQVGWPSQLGFACRFARAAPRPAPLGAT